MKQLKIAAITPDSKHDFLTDTIIQGLKELGHEIVATGKDNSVPHWANDGEFMEFAQQADCLLAFFGKVRGNNAPRYDLLNRIDLSGLKCAYVDGSEWTCTGYPNDGQTARARIDSKHRREFPWLNERFLGPNSKFTYFKRECYPQDEAAGIIPLPFAVVRSSVWEKPQGFFKPAEKSIDVFCRFGQTNDGLRAEVLDFLHVWKAQTHYSIDCSTQPLNHTAFIGAIAEARIAIDAWGGGDCCARFYEIVGNKTLIAYQKYNIVVPNPYTDGKNCIEYSSIDELRSKLEDVLSNHSKLIEMTRACVEHTELYHTARARALYMLKHMGFEDLATERSDHSLAQ